MKSLLSLSRLYHMKIVRTHRGEISPSSNAGTDNDPSETDAIRNDSANSPKRTEETSVSSPKESKAR